MIVELVPHNGIGGRPLVIDAAQLIIRLDDGTPIGAASHFGPDGGYAITHVNDPDFAQMLRAMGVNKTVIVTTLQAQKPIEGSRLLLRP